MSTQVCLCPDRSPCTFVPNNLAMLSKAAAAEGEGEEEMGEACHTMYKKECRISYRPRMTKVQTQK